MRRIEPGLGQESVWDYPRPPVIERVSKHIRVMFAGEVIAETDEAIRYLETSHPPTYYIPRQDVRSKFLEPSERTTHCEWKGEAHYVSVRVGERFARDAAWYYPQPRLAYAALADHLAFYPQMMDECSVDGEVVRPQEGSFYGGWITSNIVGPFKGAQDTMGW